MSSGHQRAAEAVREALGLLTPTWETYGVDSLSYAYPNIGKLIARTYLEVLRRTPVLWDYIYDNPDVETATREIREVLNRISSPKLGTLVRHHQPQAIVCTQAVPCSVFAAEKRRGNLGIPLMAVITDFAIHQYWIYKEVDLYCVASEEARRDLIRRGIHASKIVITGIPISPVFLRRQLKPQARSRLRLDPERPTVLIMGGSQGLGPLQELLDHLHGLPIQFIISAGVNRELYRSLSKKYVHDKKVRLFGYTRLINNLMDAADLLITKPGGLTSSEALAKGLPLIITNPIPGQEERNARYLLKNGVAERADEPAQIATLVNHLFQHPTKLRRMAEKTKDVARPYAAMEVAQHIFRLVS
uniref:Diacylglycerol glucosyltransferase n=1 Tax=uncultured bacterium CSLF42 TaxID=1091574 RepID=G4WVY0_9BACT|nr:diacylglycerol glucosyltransferase [uncultured bacterium CSLF42]